MSTLNLLASVLSYDDNISTTVNNNPYKRVPDWSTQIYGLSVKNPQALKYTIGPNSSVTLFDGTRATSIDGTTAFSITFISGSTYRLQNTAGTAPNFRTARTLGADATTAFTVSINNNSVVTYTYVNGTAPNFGTVQIGDTLYIASTSPFNILNRGYFKIIGKTATSISVQNISAAAETNIALGVNYATDFQIYSAGPVLVGDTLILSSGFSPVTLGSYVITAVTPTFIEFTSTNPLPNEIGILPTASGLVIYNNAKFILYIEVNQNCALQLNSETANNVLIQPAVPDVNGTAGVQGIFTKIGMSYKGILLNTAINSCDAFVFMAEKV